MTYDLRAYFPDSKQSIFRKMNGNPYSRYTLQKNAAGIIPLYTGYYNQDAPGYPYMWRKDYDRGSGWKTATYAVLFMGEDGSVKEVGDWFNSGFPTTDAYKLLGYKNPGTNVNTGLFWAGPGGITESPFVKKADVWTQLVLNGAYVDSGVDTYSKTGVVAHYDEFTPSHGRNGQGEWGLGNANTYQDVLHIVMYHGTRTSGTVPLRHDTPPPGARGAYYQSFENYNSYAIELWLAAGVGIIQERTPFIEDGSSWGIPNFSGEVFSTPNSWTYFIDQPPT